MKNKKNYEIDFKVIYDYILTRKILFYKFIIIFSFIGVFISIVLPNEYTSQTTITVEYSNKPKDQLSGIASIAGIDLSSIGGDDLNIAPNLYPQIFSSNLFLKKLLYRPLKYNNELVSFYEYYDQKYEPPFLYSIMSKIKSFVLKNTIGLPSKIYNFFKNSNSNIENEFILNNSSSNEILSFTEIEYDYMIKLLGQISIDYNRFDGYISISAIMPDPNISAELTKEAASLLQETIIDLKIKKSKNEFDFIEKRFNEVKIIYNERENDLAEFQDKNLKLNTKISETELRRLKSERDLSFNIYTQISTQLEKQRIKIKEETPLFTYIDPVFVPLEKSKPVRMQIVFFWTLFGFISFIFYLVLFERLLNKK